MHAGHRAYKKVDQRSPCDLNNLAIIHYLCRANMKQYNEEKKYPKYPNDSYLAATDGNRSEGW